MTIKYISRHDMCPLGGRVGPHFHKHCNSSQCRLASESPRDPELRDSLAVLQLQIQRFSSREGEGQFSASAAGGQGSWVVGRKRRSGLGRFHLENVREITEAGIESFLFRGTLGARVGVPVQCDHRVWESGRADHAGQNGSLGSRPYGECRLAPEASPLRTASI